MPMTDMSPKLAGLLLVCRLKLNNKVSLRYYLTTYHVYTLPLMVVDNHDHRTTQLSKGFFFF